MMHDKRRWGVGPVGSAEDLAKKLTESTWTLCTGFYVAGHEDYLFLNDATHEDGAAEFSIVKRLADGSYLQVESVTFSWCSCVEALSHINHAISGQWDGQDFARPVHPRLDPIEDHHCHLCA
jgi:hypothetical protein